jgi:hypothetical protein
MPHLDHLILGVADLDEGIAQFERLTGVRASHGGKHPTGTHNALVSLGDGIYLEIIALQRGVTPTTEFAALAWLKELTPVGWAVAASNLESLRTTLAAAELPLGEPEAGSRATPDGRTLRWQTARLRNAFREAPFFIAWSPDTAHPSTTNPPGCTFSALTIACPSGEVLGRLCTALDLPVTVSVAASPTVTLDLLSPKGPVHFAFPPAIR